MAIMSPGIAPARKSAPTEMDITPPQTIISMLGGMITPITEEQAVMATENRASKPCFFIAGISIFPHPAASAVDDPEIPANNIDTITLTWPRPPGSQPVNTVAKPISRSVIFPLFMRLAASRKNGTASKMNDV